MRKLFSLIAAVLFAGSMMAAVTITPANCGWTTTGGAQTGTAVEGVTISVTNGMASSGQTPDQIRIYKDGTLTISATSNITKIEFTCTANGTTKYGPGCFAAQEGYTYEAEGKTGTWTGSATSVTFTASTSQVRATEIVVTLEGEGGGETPGGDTPGGDTPGGDTPGGDTPVVTDPTNCAEAATAALSVSANNELYNGGKSYTIQGYVTSIPYAWKNGNMSFWMADTKDGGEVLEAYKCTVENEADAPAVGDKVAVTGQLTKYNTTPEFAAGCTVAIIEKAGGDTPGGDTPGGDTPGGDTPTAEGIVITPANCGWTTTAGAQTGTAVEGVTISVTNGMASSGQTPDQIRIYKDATLTVSASSNIVSIEFTCTANGTTKYGPGCFAAQEGYTYEAEGKTGTWKGSATSVTFTASTNQVRATQIVVTLEGGEVPPVEPTVNYYVAGTMNGWAAAAAYMLTPNNENLYQGEFTFAANDEFKVIGVEGETTTWFPGGMDNNFKITEAGDYKITFNPAGNVEGWYEGFFNVVKKEEPVIPQYEVAEAIAAGLTDDTEIEVRGIVTKMQIKGKNFANYGSACIYVKDATGAEGEFEFYNCYSFESAKFTSTIPAYDATSTAWADLTKLADANGNEIRLGDTIVAFGKYKLFNSTYELNTGCYIVDIKPAPVAPAQDINVNMSDGLVYSDYVASEGWWQIYGSNEKFDVSISNDSTGQAEGTYTISDLDADYTYVGVINGNDTNYVSFVDGSVTLSIDAQTGNVTVAGTLVGNDGNNYIFNLQFIVPKPTETVNVNIQNAELIDDYADYGLYGVYGTDANDIYVQFAIWAENGFQGQFTEEDLDLQYIGSAIFEGEEQVNIYTAAITVTPGNGGDYTITATVLGYNNKQYNVTMYVPAIASGIEETLATGKTVKVLRNGQLLIMKGEKTFDVTGARIR